MAFQNMTFLKNLSDLLIGHYINNYNNDDANITPLAANGKVLLGSIAFRAKGLGKAAPWTVLADAADVVATNEFAVILGDGYGYKQDFVLAPIAAGRFNAVVVKRGPAEFKEFYIKEQYATKLGAAPYDVLKQLMADQGLVVLNDVSDYKHTI